MKFASSIILITFCFSQQFVMNDIRIEEMLNSVSQEQIKAYVYKLTEFHTRHTLSETIDSKKGIGAARRWIKSEFEKSKNLIVEFDTFIQKADGRRIQEDVELKNVIATLPGKNPKDDRIILVSGHYDSRVSDSMNSTDYAPGANDDASGTSVTMELARIMSQYEFNCTIKFVAVAGEEQGLYGSKHLASLAKEKGWNLIAMITNDIVGNSMSSTTQIKDNKHVRVFSEGVPVNETDSQKRLRNNIGSENDGPARSFARYIKEISENYVDQLTVELVYRRDRYLRGGDHTPFSSEGFTAVRITEMNENYTQQHQDVRIENGIHYGDLPEFVDYPYAAKIAKMNMAAIANLAYSDPEPKNVKINISKLSNETELFWDKPVFGTPHIRVLMRKTSSPLWEKFFIVKNADSIKLPYSKDNYLFAVQSINEKGNTSLMVFPIPGRLDARK